MTSGDILKLNGTEVSEDVIKRLMSCCKTDCVEPFGMNGWAVHLVCDQSIVVYLKDGGNKK